MLIEGERDKELLINCEENFKLLTAKYSILETKGYTTEIMLNSTLKSNADLTKQIDKLTKKNNRLKTYSYITSGLTVIFGLILFL